ncbi:unnamed protein product [Allacma fusca]|uniref:Uncharacterized protein n=1 Tax=Allacma fusca TaxID=39272 RepID=A0A8J2JCG0_9HEXA|nr:unnamed protein product [Allacma fusca]
MKRFLRLLRGRSSWRWQQRPKGRKQRSGTCWLRDYLFNPPAELVHCKTTGLILNDVDELGGTHQNIIKLFPPYFTGAKTN